MKTLKESIFDEEDNLKNIDTKVIINLVQKFGKLEGGPSKKLCDVIKRRIHIGDVIIYANGLDFYTGLVTDINEDSNLIFMARNDEGRGWWIDPDKCLKINKDILNEIIKIK